MMNASRAYIKKTQKQLAEELNTNQPKISYWIRRADILDIAKQIEILTHLDLDEEAARRVIESSHP